MTRILHITHVRNLPQVFSAGVLWSPNHRPATHTVAVVNSHANIQARRAKRVVEPGPKGTLAGPKGVLHDYVPFYFGALSPMLYANHTGNVPGNPDGQQALVYLVSSVEAVQQAKLPFVFSDGHADVQLSSFFEDAAHLASLDWGVINAKYWADTPDDPDRKRRKQAEFLVHQAFPVSLLLGIAVFDDAMKSRVDQVLVAAGMQIPVAVERDWYY